MRWVTVFSIIVSLAAPARADECADSVVDYNSVLGHLLDAMQDFSTCIADSKGMDNCSRQFRRLQAVHDQFAATVAIYIKLCR